MNRSIWIGTALLALLVTNASAVETGLVTAISGTVKFKEERSSVSVLKAFTKLRDGDRIIMDGVSRVQIVYFDGGLQENPGEPPQHTRRDLGRIRHLGRGCRDCCRGCGGGLQSAGPDELRRQRSLKRAGRAQRLRTLEAVGLAGRTARGRLRACMICFCFRSSRRPS